ncbi:LacI family DNA-binding transcriptional regulator [Serratia rhizosphaerae]|uniref:LacI family DNA-binding transcriptional regulator n=1 Tax=Serratia rhizosphaerae TaxID=2597702 RepID=A0ABX6GN40_9GAMM|nr:substrate-binding domain-containing protein [Serratia rhizosphaerae]MEB6334097.1 substrate-binding domain-containing protein [Serratia rhizosphaerae]QHA87634.1 LacI family DNA-binding transcriptional regulator [Serratia rhizosphaerae]
MSEIGKNKKTTIYDLAALSGVSASAVSAILNGSWKKRRISASLAEKVTRIAEEQGYAVNRQASLLRSARSKTIGMIVPKYDNRYFGSIVEKFEEMARERGLFPVITCTRRDPALEAEAAKTMLSWQVDCMIVTGATDPDRIAEICANAGVPALNLDLPGSRAPSVISANFDGARALTRRLLQHSPANAPLLFIGGRGGDHNTRERLRGFLAAHQEAGLTVPETHILLCGYRAEKAEAALANYFHGHRDAQSGFFVNSTISLEGVVRFLSGQGMLRGEPRRAMGCFDWDPFVAMLGDDIMMVKQDVGAMMTEVFRQVESGISGTALTEIPVELMV